MSLMHSLKILFSNTTHVTPYGSARRLWIEVLPKRVHMLVLGDYRQKYCESKFVPKSNCTHHRWNCNRWLAYPARPALNINISL